MELFDTHCHIQSAGLQRGERSTRELWAQAGNLTTDQIIQNALADDVKGMICVGCDLADSQLAVDFVQDRPNCWASIGIHPHEAALATPEVQQAFIKLATATKVVAIGECGLDYFYKHSPREDQITILKFQLDLAVRAKLPVIFHVREAFDDFWPIFDSYEGKIRGVLHSFTDSRTNLDKAVERGLFLGVNGIATFAKDPEQKAMYMAIPSSSLLLETDAPFLTPAPYRGTINEPKQIKTVAEFLAMHRNEDFEQLAQITTSNTRALFNI